MRLAVLALLLTSCATLGVRGEAAKLPGLAEAESAAWRIYGRTDTPPTVLIVQGSELTCVDPNSGKRGFMVLLVDGQTCREGYTLTADRVSVSYHGEPWAETVLAHELLHAAQAREGIIDPNHTRPEWATLVPAAQAAMVTGSAR